MCSVVREKKPIPREAGWLAGKAGYSSASNYLAPGCHIAIKDARRENTTITWSWNYINREKILSESASGTPKSPHTACYAEKQRIKTPLADRPSGTWDLLSRNSFSSRSPFFYFLCRKIRCNLSDAKSAPSWIKSSRHTFPYMRENTIFTQPQRCRERVERNGKSSSGAFPGFLLSIYTCTSSEEEGNMHAHTHARGYTSFKKRRG